MLTLDQLPVELLVQTFNFLAQSRDDFMHHGGGPPVNNLASICITCKRFQVLATPLLYRRFINPETKDYAGRPIRSPCLPRFIRTLIAREDLRKLVKFVDIGGPEVWIDDEKWYRNHKFQPDSALRKQYYQAAKHHDLGESDLEWLSNLVGEPFPKEPCSEDAQTALLLCLVKDISKLSLHFHAGQGDFRFIIAFLKKNATSLTKLREWKISTREAECDIKASLHIPDLLRMPQLESVDMDGVIVDLTDYDADLVDDDNLVASPIRYLSLLDCEVELADLNRLLTRCPKLEELCLKLEKKDGREVFTWSSVVEGLRYSEKNLQNLRIYLDEPLFLSHFTALKKLCTSEVSLFGSLRQDLSDRPDNGSSAIVDALLERLPPRLSELSLEGCTVDTLRYLEVCLNSTKPIFPCLQHVSLLPRFYGMEGWDLQVKSFQNAMSKAGIDPNLFDWIMVP